MQKAGFLITRLNYDNFIIVLFQRVTEDGQEMSIAPSYCRNDQTPYDFPQENSVNIGQKLTTTELCK